MKASAKKVIIDHNDEDGKLIYKVNKTDKLIEYFVKADGKQKGYQISKIYFEGFEKLPTWLSTRSFESLHGHPQRRPAAPPP